MEPLLLALTSEEFVPETLVATSSGRTQRDSMGKSNATASQN